MYTYVFVINYYWRLNWKNKVEDYVITDRGLILYPKPEHRFSVSASTTIKFSKEDIDKFGVLSKPLAAFHDRFLLLSSIFKHKV